jgi:hypothetical protein
MRHYLCCLLSKSIVFYLPYKKIQHQVALERNLFTHLRHYLCGIKNGCSLKLFGVSAEMLHTDVETSRTSV